MKNKITSYGFLLQTTKRIQPNWLDSEEPAWLVGQGGLPSLLISGLRNSSQKFEVDQTASKHSQTLQRLFLGVLDVIPRQWNPTNSGNEAYLNIHQGKWGFLKKSSQGWKNRAYDESAWFTWHACLSEDLAWIQPNTTTPKPQELNIEQNSEEGGERTEKSKFKLS